MRRVGILVCVMLFSVACGAGGNHKSSASDNSAEQGSAEDVVSVDDEVATGNSDKAEYIIIRKQELTLSLYDSDDRLICRFPVAVGKNYGNKRCRGDMKTPEGEFTIQQIQPASDWGHDFGDGKGWIEHCYGNWFIRLKTPPHRGIGIHGTHAPESIGTRATEGCVRLEDSNLDSLKPMVKIGMPVIIIASDADKEEDARIEAEQAGEGDCVEAGN